jgi:CubicO group peptidase (beta-lactamase class C family)
MDTPLFPYIGIRSVLLRSQTPDSRIDRITVGQAAAHTAGLAPSGDGDPEFAYRKIENAVDASGPLTQAQFARYVYGLPLQSDPGKTYAYSNVGYFLLGRVIEKASGMPYMQYLQTVLTQLGIGDVVLSATDIAGRRPNEVTYDADGDGLSVLAPRTQQRLPLAYGGATYWETFDACSDLATSASSLVTFLGTYAAWGVGARAPKSARAGAMPGTESVVRNREDGLDYAFIFNKRPDADPFDTPFRRKIEALLDKGV